MPETVTSKEIANAYMEGWRLGLKALAIYSENSKRSQPLPTSNGGNTKGIVGAHSLPTNGIVLEPVRRRLPDSRMAYTHKFSVGGHEGYLLVGLYPDSGQPGKIFIRMAKEGSTLSGLMEAFAICISVSLQYGVPLEDLHAKFSFMRFEPSGYTNNRDLPQVYSIIDYLFRWMSKTFLNKEGDGSDFWQELWRTWQAANLRTGEDGFVMSCTCKMP